MRTSHFLKVICRGKGGGWEWRAFFSQGFQRQLLAAKFLETMVSMFQRQSPFQPVDLKFWYTLESPRALLFKITFGCIPEQLHQTPCGRDPDIYIFLNSPDDSKVQLTLCTPALGTKGTFSNWPLVPRTRTEHQEGKWEERELNLSHFSFWFSSPIFTTDNNSSGSNNYLQSTKQK